ncbi:vomeronasal type-1 receptor 2 [Ictidomys tridecemlineatus]|uniref:vomeronasal type-1 receptor 2-like n=1 Tax=Ictidomys tridecemlineatus TaxID=43179 RepID=UPI00038BEC9C|nr:vomeronasal type-1 receptor 2-like [Ictidomys tridecemlineatus]
MTSKVLRFGIVFLLQIFIGTLGNFSLLSYHAFLHFSGFRSRPTDLILRHLTVANSLVLLSRGIPEIMAAFGLRRFLGDIGCKLVFSVHRVARGVSVTTTCLLSVFQYITVSPRNSRWAEHREKAQKSIGLFSFLCWVLHMLLNIRTPMLMTDRWSNSNVSTGIDFLYCSAVLHDRDTNSVFAALTFSHDVLCLELMIWASGSMVLILNRHMQRVHHIHRRRVSSRSSAETRATRSILVLASAFIFSYALSSIIHVCFSEFGTTAWWMVSTSALVNGCFPTASPFILMGRERCVSHLTWRK